MKNILILFVLVLCVGCKCQQHTASHHNQTTKWRVTYEDQTYIAITEPMRVYSMWEGDLMKFTTDKNKEIKIYLNDEFNMPNLVVEQLE